MNGLQAVACLGKLALLAVSCLAMSNRLSKFRELQQHATGARALAPRPKWFLISTETRLLGRGKLVPWRELVATREL